jgi:hypothetical protein
MADELLFGKTDEDTAEDIKFHATIMDTYNDTLEVWSNIREEYERCVRFSLYGEQWSESDISKRASSGRSIITNNKLSTNIRYVVNNFKSNPPSIKIHPKGSNANKNTAEILDGIVKYIQYNSDATESYANALQSICAGGLGAWRVAPRSTNDKVELKIERIKDVLSVLVDPNAKSPNFSDMEYCFIINKISKHQFEREFPEHKDTYNDSITQENGWGDKEFVQVGEFWRKVDNKVEQIIFNGSTILERVDYPGSLIPIVFVVGEDISIGSDRKIKCLITDVIDQQKILNYTKSEIVDSIQKSTKTKYLIDYNTLSTPEIQRLWNSANIESMPYLPYDGKSGIKPDEITPGSIPSEYIEGANEASQDIQFGMGIPNPVTNIPSTQSGKAISLQLSQQNLQTYNFINSINLGIRYTGEIMLDLISYYYDEEDIMQILGVDGQMNSVPVNTEYEENGKLVYHDLTKSAEYKCMVSIGPSYSDKRSEMLDTLSLLAKEMPIVGQTAADLIIQNMDFDAADSIARRIRAGMDPKILAATNATNNDDPDTMKNNLTAMTNQLQQLQQQNQELMQKLQEVTNQNNLKLQIEQLKYQHDAEMMLMKTKLKREEEIQQLQIEEEKDRSKAELEVRKNREQLAHEIASKQHDHTLQSDLINQKHQQDLTHTIIKGIVK